jgi:hypothetical protein
VRFEPEGGAEIRAQLFLVKTDASEVRPLLKEGHNCFYGRLAPDGRGVLYLTAKRDGDTLVHRLYVADTGGSEPVAVSDKGHTPIFGYAWSLDGKKVSYAWQEGPEAAKRSVVVVGRDGKGAVTLFSGEEEASSAVADWR